MHATKTNQTFKKYAMKINVTTLEAFARVYQVDQDLIGTQHYMGLAYFWNYAYRHYLRDASDKQRKLVHDKILAENLELNGETDRHLHIIQSIVK